MKLFRKIFPLVLLSMVFVFACKTAEHGPVGTYTSAVITTSAECDMCKTKIEGVVGEIKGVRQAKVDLASKTLSVRYSKDKVSLDDIRREVSALGYQADQLPPAAAAYQALPACCKKK